MLANLDVLQLCRCDIGANEHLLSIGHLEQRSANGYEFALLDVFLEYRTLYGSRDTALLLLVLQLAYLNIGGSHLLVQ